MWQFNPLAIPLLLSTLPLAAFFVAAWPRRSELLLRAFLAFDGAILCVMIAYSFELLSATLPHILFWVRVEYLFLLTPVLYMFLIFAYIGREDWLRPGRILLLLTIPILHSLAAWTNDLHYLNWATVGVAQVGSIVLFERTYGPMFYIGIIYDYSITIVSITILINTVTRASSSSQRRLIWPLVLTALIPLVAQSLTVLRLTPVPNLDITSYGLCLSVFPLGWAIFRQRVFEIVPTAHELVFRSLNEALLVVDAHRVIIEANPSARRLLHLPTSAIVRRPCVQLFPALPMLETPDQITRAEITFDRDDETRTFDVQISPLLSQNGALRGEVLLLRDITEVKDAERALQAALEGMQRRNNELYAYDHTVAHDLRGPLTVIGGYIDLMGDTDQLPAETRRYLSQVRNATQKMSDIISHLLLLASIRDAGSLLGPVEMTPVIDSAIERVRDKIDRRGVTVEVDASLPGVQGQIVWLEEIFTNLIDNAVKYIGATNPQPKIEIRGWLDNKTACFEIRDNGIGIAPESLPTLFTMFSRLNPAEAEGTGLGLSIVRQIVEKLNGSVSVESTPGLGSTFRITLPAAYASTSTINLLLDQAAHSAAG